MTKKSEQVKAIRKKRRDILIRYKGGECAHCKMPYTGDNSYILDFHHIDPSQKLFTLKSSNLGKGMTRLYEEADKCLLLCSNCHRTEHYQLECNKVTHK